MTPDEFKDHHLKRFARGRCSAVRRLRVKSFQDAINTGSRWFPRIAGQDFVPSNIIGFFTRAEAIADAQRIKANFIRSLAHAEGKEAE